MGTDPYRMEEELPVFLPLLEKLGAAAVVADSYQMTGKYLEQVRERAFLAVFDDLFQEVWPCSLLINYNIYAPDLGMEKAYAGTGTKLLLGPSYMPLRPEYENFAPEKRDGRHVLVLTGATDPFHFTKAFLEAAEAQGLNETFSFTAVCGLFSGDREALEERYRHTEGIRILPAQPSLLPLMRESDFCVTAGGSTVYELLYAGVVPFLFSMADNQLPAARSFDRLGLIPWAGDLRDGTEPVIHRLTGLLRETADRSVYEARLEKLRGVVDGHGAGRIAACLPV